MTSSTWGAAAPSNDLGWPSGLPRQEFIQPLSSANVLVEMDTARFMAEVRTRALWWLPQMGDDVERVYKALLLISEYRIAARLRKYSRDAQLDINEAERRFEHRTGALIIKGQEEGIFRRGKGSVKGKLSVQEFLGIGRRSTVNDLTTIGHLTPSELDEVLLTARTAGDLGRSAVQRLIKGEVLTSDRSVFNTGRRRIDSNKAIQSLADDLTNVTSGLEDLVNPAELDPAIARECKEAIWAAITKITQEMSNWQ